MSIELNEATFRRLVKLYLLSLVACIVAIIIEYVVWFDVIQALDDLIIKHFGEPNEFQMLGMLSYLLVCAIAHVVAAFGLLKFKRWSKGLFWISLLAMFPMVVFPGFEFSWVGPISMWIQWISTALFGAILVLAYSRNHGSLWFATEAQEPTG